MRFHGPLTRCLLAASLGFLLLSATPLARSEEGAPRSAKVERRPFKAVFETDGVFVPAELTELSFSPKAYEAPLTVLKVIPHGSTVKEGDVILQLDDEKLEELVRGTEWALRVAERNAADFAERQGEYDADTKREVSRAQKDLSFAEKALKGHLEVARPLEKHEYEQHVREIGHSIDDQKDELAQLGKMYKEDELTEETEEIVLKRAKRNLEETKTRLALVQRRHDYGEEYSEPADLDRLQTAVQDKAKALKDLKRQRESGAEIGRVEQEKVEHAVKQARKTLEDLRRDLKSCVFRAPHEGIVIHGEFVEKIAVNLLRRGLPVPMHQTILVVARPGALKVRFALKEKDRYRLRGGMGATLIPEALPDVRIGGSLEPVRGLPLADGTWTAFVTLGNEDERILPLFKSKILVTLADEPSALTVPSAAVFQKDGRSVCYVPGKSPFGIVARTVVTGPDDGKLTIIREGLCEGDEVLLQEARP